MYFLHVFVTKGKQQRKKTKKKTRDKTKSWFFPLPRREGGEHASKDFENCVKAMKAMKLAGFHGRPWNWNQETRRVSNQKHRQVLVEYGELFETRGGNNFKISEKWAEYQKCSMYLREKPDLYNQIVIELCPKYLQIQ